MKNQTWQSMISLIGKSLKVAWYAGEDNPSRLNGIIVNETKHTLIVNTKSGRKTLLKESIHFQLEGDNDCTMFDSSHFKGTIQDRIGNIKVKKK